MTMKNAFVLALLLSSTALASPPKPPETVLVTYHVLPGKVDALLDITRQTWVIARRRGLILDTPHLGVSGKEDGGKPFVVEILRWRDGEAPDSVPEHEPEIAALWKRMGDCVEKRGHASGIEISEVDVVIGEPRGFAPAR